MLSMVMLSGCVTLEKKFLLREAPQALEDTAVDIVRQEGWGKLRNGNLVLWYIVKDPRGNLFRIGITKYDGYAITCDYTPYTL